MSYMVFRKYKYSDTNDILPPEQFGCRAHSSCEMALFAAMNSWMD